METITGRIMKCASFLAILLATRAYLPAEPAIADEATAVRLKANRIERPLTPAAISGIGGFVGTRLRANVDGYLKIFDVDRYVRMVELKQYRDWKWIGEQPGKWLESAALAAEQTGDDVLREKAEKILARLVAAQEPGGYLGITDRLLRTTDLPLRGMDAYELYFMLHGLLTAYDLWGEDSALQAARHLGDYFVDKIGPGKAEFWPGPKGQTIAGHNVHYSLEGTLLADPMLRLYQATGDRKYLDWSQWVIDNIDRWSGHNTFSKLDKVADGTLGVHELQPRVHAHTLHMNLLGFLRLYQITGDETLLRKVCGAWRDIAGRQMYVTGGVSVGEYYRPGHNLPITGEVVETCAMMSWIELSQYLLELTADPVYADAIEKLLWNHLFAAQTVDGEVFRYHTPLNGTKPKGYFHGPDCCTSSGPRITAKIPLLIYAVGEKDLYVNQFIESQAEIKLDSGNVVTLAQETDYPSDSRIVINVEPQKEEQFALNVRLPAWCTEPSLSVNGQEVSGLKPGTYAKLDRRWKKGDRVTLSLPMQVQWVKRFYTTEDLWTLERGPVVYAVDTVWWDEHVAEQLGSVPEDLSKVIKVLIEKPKQTDDLQPAGVLGPAIAVMVVLPNGKRAEVKVLPFANVGRWYSDAAQKPNHDESRYAYAVWLGGVKNIPAFPGAEGAGAVTPGGRGGKVIEVTNLNDSGPGSLREAVQADGPRIVVFRVSGIITLEKILAIANPFITIAGQTAPGDGICIRGQTTEINTHDVVLRYLRFRRGNIKDRNDALGGYPVRNIIIDHCSASWGLDENLSLYRYMKKMPDEWEEKFGLNPNDPSDGATDKDSDGYTNVEEWLNSTDPTQYVDYSNNPSAVNLVPTELRCEDIRNPLGIDTARHHLFWKLESTSRSQTQTAFQILVASSAENLNQDKGDLWDSGKVVSDETIYIQYEGRPLKSSQQVFWKVRIWDKDGKISSWSEPASWTTGLLNQGDWQAKWITAVRTDKDPLPIFRKSFRLDKSVRRAVIHICGLGHYELRLNGRRVGDYEMDPGWTNYRKTCLYSTYDVTNMLVEGDNVIGVMLGNGMYNVPGGRYTKFKGTFGPPKLICQMHVTFVDGSTGVIASDQTWTYALGPVLFTCIYGGEDYDARREQTGWDKPAFDDSKWSQAEICDGPGGNLAAQYAPPIKVAAYLPAIAFHRLEEGKYEVDCGTNLSARPVIKVRGPSGSKVVITCAEKRGQPWLQDGGHVYNYTLKGEGEEVFQPRFTYFSFQYLYVSGAERPNDAGSDGQRVMLLDAGSEFLTSSAPAVGDFECSNMLFNDINAMIDRSVRSNLQSVLTDCPHREKLGWLEVPHLMGPSIFYHRDVYNLYRKICRDTTESQLDSGLVPDIAPEYTRFNGGFFESPEWGSACVQLPELLYKWYGDNAIERQQYETMKRYTLYLASTRNEQGLAKAGLGDWYDWTQENGHRGASQLTPGELPATVFLYDNARILNRTAARLGKKADAAEFEKLTQQVRRDFIRAYYKPAAHSVATGSQAALATALYFGLVPEEGRQDVLANLVAKLEEANYRQSTGEVCFRMLVQALADGGRSDVVYRMINRTDAPGYGHMLKLGFKTLSERWDKPGSSMNHCMFGHIQEWFQNSILGIRQAPDSVGFKRLLLRPESVGDLTFAFGYYDSIRGRIESRWRIEGDHFYWHVTVPPNTTAELHVPTSDTEKITESDRPIDRSRGIVFLRIEPARETKKSFSRAVFEVGSGEYEFQSRLK